MNTQTVKAPAELINLIGIDAEVTREFAYSHQSCDGGGKFLYWVALLRGGRYAVTDEDKEMATIEMARMKRERVSSVGDSLVFVGMGMNYVERYPGDVCNHRIRTEIVNPEGRRFFIEVGTGRGDTMRIDHVVDRDQEKEYEDNLQRVHEKIEAAGGFYKNGRGSALYEQLEKWRGQPYYWYKAREWQSLNVQYTKANVLKLVNDLFDCHFSDMEVEYNLLSTEDYTSTSPAFDAITA